MNIRRKFSITLFCIFFLATTFASDINKAFKYLTSGDYPNALKYLNEVLAEEPDDVAVNYGLAKYYFSRDNKAYNLDSANKYIKRAMKKLPLNPEDKSTKKLLNLGIRDFTIQSLQKDIEDAAYRIAENANTVDAYQYFIDNYTDKGLINRSTDLRNQLAFRSARAKADYKAMDEFIKKYPNASEIKEAIELYEKLLYEQTTADKTYQSYKKYIDNYPKGAYIVEAKKKYEEELILHHNREHSLEAYVDFVKNHKDHPAYNSVQDSIFVMVTKPGTVAAMKEFIEKYPDNRNINEAWQQLYQLYTWEATETAYISFSMEFPNFPDQKKLSNDRALSRKELKPFQQGGKWGYAYNPTPDSLMMLIDAFYEEAFEFRNGLAAVRAKECTDEKCTYFYMDKSGNRAFSGEFNFAGDYHKGYAVVGLGNCEEADSCMYGIIDKRGKFVVPAVYQFIDDESEGLYAVSKNDRYGYIDARGEVAISLKYTDALPFSEGIAAVALDSNWFFIDKQGGQVFFNTFKDISSFKDSLAAVTLDGVNWGYIDRKGNFVIDALYETAEDFENGFGIVSKREKDPKIKGMTILQRYKIDKKGKLVEKLTAPKEPTAKKKKRK